MGSFLQTGVTQHVHTINWHQPSLEMTIACAECGEKVFVELKKNSETDYAVKVPVCKCGDLGVESLKKVIEEQARQIARVSREKKPRSSDRELKLGVMLLRAKDFLRDTIAHKGNSNDELLDLHDEIVEAMRG